MGQTRTVGRSCTGPLAKLVAGIVLITLTGCDYWPPALQTQIEQLKADLQTITAERARLEEQVATLSRARDEMQGQIDQLTRLNRERSSTIGELERALKVARASKSVPPASASAKHLKKSTAKAAPSKTSKKTSRPPAKKKSTRTGTYSKTIR